MTNIWKHTVSNYNLAKASTSHSAPKNLRIIKNNGDVTLEWEVNEGEAFDSFSMLLQKNGRVDYEQPLNLKNGLNVLPNNKYSFTFKATLQIFLKWLDF